MDIREIKENKLKTIIQFSVPSIIAMLLQTAITITDGYFTGNYVSENALAAINLGLPILKVLRADGELSGFFTQYYRIMLFTYPLMVVGTILGMFLHVDGKPQICMLVGILSCVLNAILDFLFVGRLSMGVQVSLRI